MGQEIMLYPDPDQIPRLKEYIKKLRGTKDNDYLCITGPDFNGFEMNCWIKFRKVDWEPEYDDDGVNDFEGIDEFLEIGYQSHHYKSDFAKCLAWEFNKRFTFLKAGWDSIGWCDDFWDREPFLIHIEMKEDLLKRKNLTEEMKNSLLKEIEGIKIMQKTCMKFAEDLFTEADK